MKKARSRQEIANEYGINRKTLQRWIEREKIIVSSGLLTPKEQELIFEKFGHPQAEKVTNAER